MPSGLEINIGELSKPINTLVEKISNAAGILYEPTRIKRKANAEAEAKKTKIVMDLEIDDLQKRAMNRFLQEETIKQHNIENIVEKSFDKINYDATPEDIENDWIANFFDKSKFISDSEMQELWSEILAGESNKPGTYSRRTIEQLSLLSKKDAELFRNLCKFSFKIDNEYHLLILNYTDEIYKNNGITFTNLMHLNHIGLITFDTNNAFSVSNIETPILNYFGKCLNLSMKDNTELNIHLGSAFFTETGQDLVDITNAQYNDEFYNFIIEFYKSKNIKVSESPEIII